MTTAVPCPKCGNKNGWEGPRHCVNVPNNLSWVDFLSYTCINCRFTRYEAPLDRQGDPNARDSD